MDEHISRPRAGGEATGEEQRVAPWSFGRIARSYRVVLALAVIALASLFVDRFTAFSNLLNILRQIALLSIVSYGMALTLLIGGIDLSIGSVAALGTVLGGTLVASGNVVGGILLCLVTGALAGATNGFMISRFKIPDFIMTFSMMYIARGAALTYTRGVSFYGYPKLFLWIGKGAIGPVPVPVVLSAALLLALYFLLRRTVFGRYLYAVGANKRAALYTGMNVRRKTVHVYMISGVIAAVAGLVFIARLNSADAELGQMWALEAIAVCVIGGVSFSGGEGDILGLLLGAVVMAVISNCINLLGIPPRLQDFFTGFVIVAAAAADHYLERTNRQRGL